MSKINVCFISQDGIETLRRNKAKVTKLLQCNTGRGLILKKIFGDDYETKYFEKKKYTIEDFVLKTSGSGNYDEVDYENSIQIYEHLSMLPRYIITDERFWAWFNFTIGYNASLQAMKLKDEGTFARHWLFEGGNRRGIFFGVMSRCYFRVERTIDERLLDKYELTKFAIENPERFRNLTWRSNSNEKRIVIAVLRAEKDICDKYKDKVKNSVFKEIAKDLSLYSSVRLIDVIEEKDIYNFVYTKMENIITNDN